eukprot:Blabericola_migrator_1__747@NODE_1186_length_5187_cov_125_914258_g807_i0_p7_GENE_NODE_1186_length_5187_cov_125_914258_g807_i0NODE_1186_length_5187_cov_125_914258_g807_i0_p7_ORF_typecomplete_len124_score8_03SUIM_assoc/PF16619_5/0_14_NODE_1186_length_5187_cov_125_914258_g807_i014311802
MYVNRITTVNNICLLMRPTSIQAKHTIAHCGEFQHAVIWGNIIEKKDSGDEMTLHLWGHSKQQKSKNPSTLESSHGTPTDSSGAMGTGTLHTRLTAVLGKKMIPPNLTRGICRSRSVKRSRHP